MKKKCLLMIVASLIFATTNVQTLDAQEIIGHGVSQTSVLPVMKVSEATNGYYNFKSFEVKVSQSGYYFTEFWLLPARYANNSYTTFIVYVNDHYVGTINPSVGNWQSARVSGKETLELKDGVNVITIATPAPEFPEVENIKVALNDSEATFSSVAYEEYLEGALSGISYDIPERDGISAFASAATAAGLAHFSNVPLNYTFYKTFSFTQGQEIFITSSSSAQHKIDVVYYGSNPQIVGIINPDRPGIIYPNYPELIIPNTSGNIVNAKSKVTDSGHLQSNIIFRTEYTPATSEEMQGLSYVYLSEKTKNSSMQVATAKLTIPKTGQYLVRVRHAVSGGSSVADVNINGAYFYENAPISLSYVDCIIPADGNLYATMTCCNNFGIDDPYLFIHGAKSDRIVGFNDNGPIEKLNQFNLSVWDSYISQKYHMKTSGISVSNSSSSKPSSRCNIIARILEDAANSVAKVRTKRSEATRISPLSISESEIQIVGPEYTNGVIIVSANENILKISLYGLSGNCIGTVSGNGLSAIVPTSALNMTQPGVYIVSVATVNGITSKKFAVK